VVVRKGKVTVDGKVYELGFKEALYVGKGNQHVVFSSNDAKSSAKFYLNTAPAHHAYPTKKITKAEAEIVELGSLETANHRTINKLLVNSVVETWQLMIGLTELITSYVWNPL